MTKYDSDKNGNLNRCEFDCLAMEIMKYRYCVAQWKCADADCDGKVTMDELRCWLDKLKVC